MKICVVLNPSRLIRWHLWLVEDLSTRLRHDVEVHFSEFREAWPVSVSLLFQLENVLYRRRSSGAAAPVKSIEFRVSLFERIPHIAPFDAVINLSGQPDGLPPALRTIAPLFNSIPDELAAVSALLDAQPLIVTVHNSVVSEQPIEALPALEDHSIISLSLGNILSRTAELILRSLRLSSGMGTAAPPLEHLTGPPAIPQTLQHLAGTVAKKAQAMLAKRLAGGERWAIGWRPASPGQLLQSSAGKFHVIPDDGRRFFADPFVFEHTGMTYLFCEEFPFATGKGILSVFSRATDGSWSAPVPILEESYHLSYPFIFGHDGNIWMVPESGQNRTIDLYRAIDFPVKWEKERTLLDGVAAYDATLHARDDGWWMLATTRHMCSATTDNLEIFHADTLAGHWAPHQLNPVMMDSRHSRSAGAISANDGVMLRPTQDCSRIYGGAISLARIDALGLDRYTQTVVGRIHARDFGVHTYNSGGGLEVVDIFGFVSGVKNVKILCSRS